MMKLLLLINIFFIISCGRYISKYENDFVKKPVSYIQNKNNLLYKASITFFKSYYSGLLYIKPIAKDTVRYILLSEIGLKLLDFQINNGNPELKYCIEPLEKKIILNNIYNDFKIMTYTFDIEKYKAYQKNEIINVKYYSDNRIKGICTSEINNFTKLNYKSGLFSSIDIYFQKFNIENIPEIIKIKHKFKNIKLELNLLEYK